MSGISKEEFDEQTATLSKLTGEPVEDIRANLRIHFCEGCDVRTERGPLGEDSVYLCEDCEAAA